MAGETRTSTGRHPEVDLSARQRDVLTLLHAGRTNREIGRALGLSPNTVKSHGKAASRRLAARDAREAAAVARALGLL
jgi:DNA-binding NarL/FixJ family response regulator